MGAKENRMFTDSEFLKKCMLGVVEIVYPDNKEFDNISLSRRTAIRVHGTWFAGTSDG